jgi:DNA-binding CsgD family transcriptional regulator
VITHSRKTGDGRPRAISDFLTAEEFHATRLYQDFYAVIGTEDQISFVLPAADVTVGITVDRPRRGFDARDRWVLNAIRPHLVQAYRNAFAFERARQVVRTIGTACDSGGRPVIVLDPRGAVEYQTPEAARWLRRLAVQDWTTLMEWARQPQRRDAPEWPLAIGGCAVRRAWCDEWTVLTLNDGAVATCRGLQRVGLTGREAEVMLLISEGLASKEVALRLALSPRTVDKHVANALSKLGVHNRVAAVNLVRQAAEGGTGDPEARHQLGAALRQ